MTIYRAGSGIFSIGGRILTPRAAAAAAAGGVLSAAAVAALVSWWSLDETSGTRVDSHGSNNLTDNNTVGFAAGKQGNAADFEFDNTEYLSIASNATLQLNNVDFTLCGWFNAESIPGTGKYPSLYTKPFEYGVNISRNGDNKPALVILNGTTYTGLLILSWGSTISVSTWYFFCAWHDASEKRGYLSINNGTPVSGTYTATPSPNAQPFSIGRGDTTDQYDGLADELAIFKGYILTADERTAMFNAGAGVTYAQAVGA